MANNQPKEEIVLCKMFTGNYWEDENNLGYETINMFLPDNSNGESYIYLPACGDYKLEDHEIKKVLLVRSVPKTDGKTLQILGKADVVKNGELLRDPNKENNPRIKKCISGSEFEGLHTIYEVFSNEIDGLNQASISSDEVEAKLVDIAKKYGLEPPKSKKDFYNLAVKLGVKRLPAEKEIAENKFKVLIVKEYSNAYALRKVFESQKENVRNTKYWDISYDEMFQGNEYYGKINICATLRVEKLCFVKKDKELYLTIEDDKKKSADKRYRYIDPEELRDDNEGKPALKKISAQSQKVYLPYEKIGKELWGYLSEREKEGWFEDPQPLRIEKKDIPYLQDSFLTVMKKEYDELTYSNLFAHFFKKSSQFTRYFFENIKYKKKREDSKYTGVELSLSDKLSAQSIAISDEDWKKAGGGQVKREEKNIDIILRSNEQVIVIENKIKSALNGVKVEVEQGDEVESDEKNDKTTNKKITYKDQLGRYYSYIEEKYPVGEHRYFIFAPDYNPIEDEDFGRVNGMEMDEVWRIVRYSDIFKICKVYNYHNDIYFDEFDKTLFGEFLKALNVHTDSNANNYYRQMQKRLLRIKNKQGEKNENKNL